MAWPSHAMTRGRELCLNLIRLFRREPYEPDAVVNCGPRLGPEEVAATNPVIVAEVLSPPSIQHYLIVRARRHEIIHHWRSGDAIVARVVNLGSIRLDPPGITIAVNDVYAT
jgi:hypothetical protein